MMSSSYGQSPPAIQSRPAPATLGALAPDPSLVDPLADPVAPARPLPPRDAKTGKFLSRRRGSRAARPPLTLGTLARGY